MFPELVRLGSIAITTKSVFHVLALLTTAFVFWRKAREEHYHEEQIFDAFLLAVMVGLVVARLGYVVVHGGEFMSQPWLMFDVVGHSGSIFAAGLAGASLYLYRFCQQHKWDTFEVLDFWFLSVAAGIAWMFLGDFFAGVGFGYETSLPWGVVFPGVFSKHHPVQLYTALFFVGLHIYLAWSEYNYRTFTWYRSGKKTAQTGFLTSVFLLASGLFALGMVWLRPPQWLVPGVPVDLLLAMGLIVAGAVLLYLRSGRTIIFWRG